MAGPSRVTQLVFGSTATSGQMVVFGSLAAGTPTTATGIGTGAGGVQNFSEFLSGLFSAVVGNNAPTVNDLNSLFWVIFYQLNYILERGVPDWDSGTTYNIGDIVKGVGSSSQYFSLINSNTNNAVGNTANWAPLGGSLQTKSANYTALSTDAFIKVSTTCTMTLPDATVRLGQRLEYVKTDSNATTVTFNTQSAQTISGVASGAYTLVEQYSFVAVRSDGTNWYVVAAG